MFTEKIRNITILVVSALFGIVAFSLSSNLVLLLGSTLGPLSAIPTVVILTLPWFLYFRKVVFEFWTEGETQ